MKRRIDYRRLALVGGALLTCYLLLCGLFYRWMIQPPGVFAAHVARLPVAAQYGVMMGLPFESMWLVARAGRLHVGDVAPDFTLPRLGKAQEQVQLSAFRGARPVVLVFGSYT